MPNEQPDVELEQDIPPRCTDITWVFPPCLHDRRRDYSDDLRRVQLKLKMPGSDWVVGVLARVQCLEDMPVGASNLTGPADTRAVAEVVVLVVEALQLEEEELAQYLGIVDVPAATSRRVRGPADL